MESRRGSKRYVALAVLAIALFQGPVAGSETLPVDQVRVGMKGYGLTVVRGYGVERFDVEVLGVLRNAAVGRSVILVSLSGLDLADTGVVAGMSGSPVYLEGRLAGAIASGWGFSKKAVAGVTPIESMASIVPERPVVAGPGRPAGPPIADRAAFFARLAIVPEETRLEELRRALLESLPAVPASSTGGTTLLSFQGVGIPASTVAAFREPLSRIGLSDANLALLGASPSAVAAGAETSVPATLAPGASVTAFLVRGDLQLGATGTVTEVFPDGRFVAFGHPFLGAGELELPVAPAEVVTVVSSLYQSFKLASGGEPRYRLTNDRDTGVGGRTDRTASTIPVTVLVGGDGRTPREFRFEAASHPKLLPLLAGLVADASMTAADPTPRDRLLSFRIALDTASGEVSYEDVATGGRAKESAVLSTVALAAAVADNDLGDPGIRGIRLRFESSTEERRLRLVEAAPASRKVAPGETLVVAIRLADRRGEESVRVVRLPVPPGTPEGRATLVVSDGNSATALRQLLDPSEPRTLGEFATFISRIVPGNRLLAGLLVATRGAATRSSTLEALPPTALALLAGAREQGETG
ncbi:MAG TPA: hypothetical protein VE129_02710, partial [Thermoanaerobaculia bacterium]|nr:hypothetical protein [Thermoanaerobaculia bacterium]